VVGFTYRHFYPPGYPLNTRLDGTYILLGVLEESKLPFARDVIEPRIIEHVSRSLDTMLTAASRLSIVCRVTEADICGYGSAQVTVCNYVVRYSSIFSVVFLFVMESEWVRPLEITWKESCEVIRRVGKLRHWRT
jgi:hypothetical protein